MISTGQSEVVTSAKAGTDPEGDVFHDGCPVERARYLSQFFEAPKGKVIVLMAAELQDGFIHIPAQVTIAYERTQRGIDDWPEGYVVSSGIDELKAGETVLCNFRDGLMFDGGQYDRDSLFVSGLLLPGETLRFFRPLRDPSTFDRRRSTQAQVDMGAMIVGL